MFEPDSRVVLLDQLRPPAGYSLHSAVGTTFSLSLQTALVPPLAFAAFTVRDSIDPVAVLEAARSCTDRVDVFCQAGQIAVPRAHSDLMAFLEPMVHPVQAMRRGYLFHPKVWFLRYAADENDRDVRYRLLVATRNLVDSDAWDLAVTLDGAPTRANRPVNRPLSAFLRALPGMAVTPLGRDRASRVADLADQAKRVQWDVPDGIGRVDFHAWGIPRLTPTADFSGYRHLVMSPFMDAEGLRHVAPSPDSEVHIVSRGEALDAMDESDLPMAGPGRPPRLLVLDPLAGLIDSDEAEEAHGEGMSDSDGAECDGERMPTTLSAQRVGLHAKATIVERNNREAHLFVGSPNATRAAYDGNVEFAVEFTGRAGAIGVQSVLGTSRVDTEKDTADAAARGLSGVLQPYERQPANAEAEARRRALAKVLRRLAAVPLSARVIDDGGAYDERVSGQGSVPTWPTEMSVRASLLTRPAVTCDIAPGEVLDVTFGPVDLAEVTPFVVLMVTDADGMVVSSVVHAALLGDPPDRLNAILARQIDTPAKFLHFLHLLLALSGDGSDWTTSRGVTAGTEWGTVAAVGVLESIAAALARGSRHLEAMDGLLARLNRTEAGRKVIPEGFDALWQQVQMARERLDRDAER